MLNIVRTKGPPVINNIYDERDVLKENSFSHFTHVLFKQLSFSSWFPFYLFCKINS